MKGVSIWAVALAATLTIACGDTGSMNDNTAGPDRTAAANPNADTGAAGTAGANRDAGATAASARANNADDANRFIEKMGHVGAAEIKLGQLAAERAANPEVKQFGRRMVADHQKASAELKQVASKMSVTLPAQPDEKQQELADRLSKLKGAEFDREYMKAMVDGHEELRRSSNVTRAQPRGRVSAQSARRATQLRARTLQSAPGHRRHCPASGSTSSRLVRFRQS